MKVQVQEPVAIYRTTTHTCRNNHPAVAAAKHSTGALHTRSAPTAITAQAKRKYNNTAATPTPSHKRAPAVTHTAMADMTLLTRYTARLVREISHVDVKARFNGVTFQWPLPA